MAKWPVYDQNLKFFVAPRKTGKTTKMIDWVLEGVNTDSYPYNSRVIICTTLQEGNLLRDTILRRLGKEEFDRRYAYNMVFHVSDWIGARKGRDGVEIAIDNADMMLRGMVEGTNSVLVWATATGEVVHEDPTRTGPDVQE
jgi:hypothetical protein